MARQLNGNGEGTSAEVMPHAQITLSVHQLFGHFKDAMSVGSGHATELIEGLTKALAQAYSHIDTLVAKIISLSAQLGDLASKSVALMEVEAQRDIKIAEVRAVAAREEHLLALANSPFGKEMIGLMRRLVLRRLGDYPADPELRKAARRAMDKILSDSALLELMAEAAGDDWIALLDWLKEGLQ